MSPVAVAIWSQDLEPNKRNVYTVENDIRISGASLAAQLKDNTGRTVVEVVIKIPDDYEIGDIPTDEKTGEKVPMHRFVLCALTPGKAEQLPLDLILPEGEEIEFVVTGKNPVHLYGNYIVQGGNSDEDEDEDEDEYDLEDAPSDVEVDLDELDDVEEDSARFEEIEASPPKSVKRAREDEEMGDVSVASGVDTSVMSKKEKKRAKKLKNEAGKAAPAPTTTTTTTVAATTTTVAPANGKDSKPIEKEKKEGKKDGEKKKKDLASHEPRTLAGGVTIEDKKVGTGPVAKAGKKIGMRYIGRLKNGKVFDSNTKEPPTPGKPFFFTLGEGNVIKGWDEGIPGMSIGGERILTIPAAKGYGKRGAPPDIPPNADLIFEVKLVEIK
ncbi:peptidylprolyl isomerase fpr4 [Ceratobasidium sp. 370]|nr:peptidylprolyl isomerase fpr4 [Ceratobasidium sp. 370]